MYFIIVYHCTAYRLPHSPSQSRSQTASSHHLTQWLLCHRCRWHHPAAAAGCVDVAWTDAAGGGMCQPGRPKTSDHRTLQDLTNAVRHLMTWEYHHIIMSCHLPEHSTTWTFCSSSSFFNIFWYTRIERKTTRWPMVLINMIKFFSVTGICSYGYNWAVFSWCDYCMSVVHWLKSYNTI